jgi:hypothetical protein
VGTAVLRSPFENMAVAGKKHLISLLMEATNLIQQPQSIQTHRDSDETIELAVHETTELPIANAQEPTVLGADVIKKPLGNIPPVSVKYIRIMNLAKQFPNATDDMSFEQLEELVIAEIQREGLFDRESGIDRAKRLEMFFAHRRVNKEVVTAFDMTQSSFSSWLRSITEKLQTQLVGDKTDNNDELSAPAHELSESLDAPELPVKKQEANELPSTPLTDQTVELMKLLPGKENYDHREIVMQGTKIILDADKIFPGLNLGRNTSEIIWERLGYGNGNKTTQFTTEDRKKSANQLASMPEIEELSYDGNGFLRGHPKMQYLLKAFSVINKDKTANNMDQIKSGFFRRFGDEFSIEDEIEKMDAVRIYLMAGLAELFNSASRRVDI